jgi:uncharacterized lipoprotein YmbA
VRRIEMAHPGLPRFIAVTCILCSTLFCGCGSTAPSRFYTLSAVKGIAAPAKDAAAPSRFTVGVGPVEIPDFLERPHIVTRNGENGLELAEYDRWAGSLKQDIARVLAQDLAGILPPGATVVSWKRSVPLDYRVAVDVTRLDVVPGREVLLRSQWTIFGKEPKTPLAMRTGTFTEQLAGRDYNAAVEGIGKAVEQLSEAVAADIEAARTGERIRTSP